MTVPVPGLLDSLGVAGAPGFTDSRTFIESCRPTADGRMVVTKSGGALPFGDRVDASLKRTRRSTRELRAIMAAYHPALADVAIEGTWCGPIDRSRDGLPMFGHLGSSPDIVFGCGYSGAGIVPSRVGSHILASLVQERDDRVEPLAPGEAAGTGLPPGTLPLDRRPRGACRHRTQGPSRPRGPGTGTADPLLAPLQAGELQACLSQVSSSWRVVSSAMATRTGDLTFPGHASSTRGR